MSFRLHILKLPTASLAETNKRSLLLNKDLLVVGRSEKCDLVLFDEHRLISREHFTLQRQNEDWVLHVVSTVNSVQINEREVGSSERHLLQEGEHIFVGAYELRFERVVDDSKTQFAPVEVAKNKELSPLEEFTISNTVSVEQDPFADFLQDVKKEFNSTPDTFSPSDMGGRSGVVDVFGLDTPSDVLMPSSFDIQEEKTELPIISGTVDIFGLDSHSKQKEEPQSAAAVSFEHAHPIHEPMTNLSALGFNPNLVLNEGNTTKRLLIEALGLEYERFSTLDEKELIDKIGFLLSSSLGVIVDLLRLRSATKLEVGTVATTLTVNNNNPLKYSPNAVVALGYLLGKPQIGFMSYQDSMKSTRDDLVAYNRDLLNVTQKLGKQILKELSPVTIEADLDSKGGFSAKIPVQREAKLWAEYKKQYESCDVNLDQIIKKVF